MHERRTFLKQSAAGFTAGSIAFNTPPSFASTPVIDARIPFKRTSRYKSELVTIGMIGSRHGAHTQNIWGQKWNPVGTNIRTTGMNCRFVWCLRKEDRTFYREKYGFEPVTNPEDMIGHIDGVIVDDFYGTPVNHLMAKPFLEAGVPTFVNRPCSTSLDKARFLIKTAEKHKTPLMSGSTWEYTESCGDVRESLKHVKDIKGYAAYNSMSDFYTHGVHGIYYIYSCLKDEIKKGRGKVRSASYMTPNWRKPGGCITFEHETPEGVYYGSLHEPRNANAKAYIRVFCNRPFDVEGKIPASPGNFQYNTWNAMQLVIQEMFETKKSPEESVDILEKLTMFLMAFKSVSERNGGPVGREEIEGWELFPPSEQLLATKRENNSTAYTINELKQIAEVFGGDYNEP